MKAYQQPQISLWELSVKDVLTNSPLAISNPSDEATSSYIDDTQGTFGKSFDK